MEPSDDVNPGGGKAAHEFEGQGALCGINPTSEMILSWISASGQKPWYPSLQAKSSGIPRENFDEPLNELRIAGFIQIESWIRGAGQGYVLTPRGISATATATTTALSDTVLNERAFTTQPEPSPIAIEPLEVKQEEAERIDHDLRLPIVIPALLLVCLIWFCVGLVMATRSGIALRTFIFGNDTGLLQRLGAVSIPDLVNGDWWRLATDSFVHSSIWHLVLDVFGLGVAGAVAEMVWGSRRIVLIIALCSIAGTCVTLVCHPNNNSLNGSTVHCGSSAIVWGMIGAVFSWAMLYRDTLQFEVALEWSRRLALTMMLFMGANLVPGMLPSADWMSQLAGAVMGFIAAGLLNAVRECDRLRKLVAIILLLFLPCILFGTLRMEVISERANQQLK